MLIGDWECNVTEQIALWKDGVFQDYYEAMESKIKQAFFVENGVFMVKESNRQSSSVFNLKSYYGNKVYVKSVDDYQFKITRNIEYITKGAFKLLNIVEIDIISSSEKENNNTKTKNESICKRITK